MFPQLDTFLPKPRVTQRTPEVYSLQGMVESSECLNIALAKLKRYLGGVKLTYQERLVINKKVLHSCSNINFFS
jgi:hypothetical protein